MKRAVYRSLAAQHKPPVTRIEPHFHCSEGDNGGEAVIDRQFWPRADLSLAGDRTFGRVSANCQQISARPHGSIHATPLPAGVIAAEGITHMLQRPTELLEWLQAQNARPQRRGGGGFGRRLMASSVVISNRLIRLSWPRAVFGNRASTTDAVSSR